MIPFPADRPKHCSAVLRELWEHGAAEGNVFPFSSPQVFCASLQTHAGMSWGGWSESLKLYRERRGQPPGNNNGLWVFPRLCCWSCSDLQSGQRGLLRSCSCISLTTHTQAEGTSFPIIPGPFQVVWKWRKKNCGKREIKWWWPGQGKPLLSCRDKAEAMFPLCCASVKCLPVSIWLVGWQSLSYPEDLKTKQTEDLCEQSENQLHGHLMLTLLLDLSHLAETAAHQEQHSWSSTSVPGIAPPLPY